VEGQTDRNFSKSDSGGGGGEACLRPMSLSPKAISSFSRVSVAVIYNMK
jgi:hypothetical protein